MYQLNKLMNKFMMKLTVMKKIQCRINVKKMFWFQIKLFD